MTHRFPQFDPAHERSGVGDHDVQIDYSETIELLESERLKQLVESGQISLAMVKPHVGPEANKLGLDDSQAADMIEDSIEGLAVVTKFSFTFEPDVADVFYEEPAVGMATRPAMFPDKYENRWEEYRELMTSGPVTVLILHGENAIEQWRAHLGHWNIEKYNDPNTIRGALGVDNHNNLVHGSDSIESVQREIAIVTEQLRRLTV